MTDILALAEDVYDDVKEQTTIEDVCVSDLAKMVKRAIKELYNLTSRSNLYSEDKFTQDKDQTYISFDDDLTSVESSWVVYEAECSFYKVQRSGYTDAVGYSTDAMTVSHADKPFKNLSEVVKELEDKKNVLLTRMYQYTILGVAG